MPHDYTIFLNAPAPPTPKQLREGLGSSDGWGSLHPDHLDIPADDIHWDTLSWAWRDGAPPVVLELEHVTREAWRLPDLELERARTALQRLPVSPPRALALRQLAETRLILTLVVPRVAGNEAAWRLAERLAQVLEQSGPGVLHVAGGAWYVAGQILPIA
ncbi:MAG: hypothetical protein VKP62_09550 [Candidatus Sericytochromatia bacterium]|nr:hypothetical protein [Candidatus Sericytochromatia bacterium]